MSDIDDETRRRYDADPAYDRRPVRTRRSPMPWIAALVVIAILAIGGFFLFGGDADIDTDGGNIDVPSVDADVDAPDIDVESPDVNVDPGSVDVDGGDADANTGS